MEDVATKLLTQTSESIHRLLDITTRMDERVKSHNDELDGLDERLDKLAETYSEILQRIAVLESQSMDSSIADIYNVVESVKKEVIDLDKRLASTEGQTDRAEDRWKNVTTFIVQLIWIVLASWMLLKLNLNPPAVP